MIRPVIRPMIRSVIRSIIQSGFIPPSGPGIGELYNTVELYNLLGEKVSDTKIKSGETQGVLKVNGLSNMQNVYFIQIK